MAFTISNMESVKGDNRNKNLNIINSDDWKSLIDQSAKRDEISITKEILREKQKKEDYKSMLDMQNRYISSLKKNQGIQKYENNTSERMILSSQVNNENDFKIGIRLKSMEKQKLINEENRMYQNIKNRNKSINKTAEATQYKENPIEMRLRQDHLRSLEQNKVREKEILDYNNNAAKISKIVKEQHREKEVYHSKEFNDFVEHQAINHKINLLSQQDKYETKRQQKDFMFIRNRTISVKKMIEDIIAQYNEKGQSSSSEMQELKQMLSAAQKCLVDLEIGESLKPGDLDSFSRDVHSKTNFILGWQIQNKKITEIENKLKDKQYSQFIQNKIGEEMDELNKKYVKKKEDQMKYLNELQQQEKFHKLVKKAEDEKISGFDFNLKNDYTDRKQNKNKLNNSAFEAVGSRNRNKTIDVLPSSSDSPNSSQYHLMNLKTTNKNLERYGRKHKNDIPFANKNFDQMGNIIHGDHVIEVKSNRAEQRIQNNSRSSNRNKIAPLSNINEVQAKDEFNSYNRKIEVRSSLDTINNSKMKNDSLSIVGDYTPSQNINVITNKNTGL